MLDFYMPYCKVRIVKRLHFLHKSFFNQSKENHAFFTRSLFTWLQFFTIGRPFAGLFCLLLQLTLIGWIPATIWSVYALSQYKTDKKIESALARRA